MAELTAARGLVGVHKSLVKVVSHAAATATEQWPIFMAPFPCLVTAVKVVAQAAVTGADTNTTHLNIINKGSAGAGTTEIANRDLVLGTDLVGFGDTSIALTGTTAQKTLAEGDVLTLQHEKVGTGLLVPELLVEVSYRAL